MAGDVRTPKKNLPRAMVASVVIVGAFHVLTIFVATSVFGSARPAELGETAVEEFAEVLDRMVEELEEAGADVDARMVFAPDLLDTASRVAREEACDAMLLARPLPRLEKVLVPLRAATT